MADIMLQLGSYQFEINTAAYQELRKSTEYRWPAQDRFGQRAALQFVGIGSETITLQGAIYPQFRGGLHQVTAMKTEAGKGKPLLLLDGNGFIHGRWVIERIDEGESIFAPRGSPRKIEFTVSLRKYDDGANV